MILMYQSSNGQTFDLKVDHLRTRRANFHDYAWTPKTIEQQYGSRVYRFDKGAVSYSALLSIFGSIPERRSWLNILHAAFDYDIANMTPGKIVHGMYSIECFITMSSTYYEDPFTQNAITIYCPYPFWSMEDEYTLTMRSDQSAYEYLDYTYDYSYDYQAALPGYARIKNDAVRPCNWKITLHGPCTNPIISVDGRKIGVNALIGIDETLVITSKDKTVIKYGPTGEENLFNDRIKGIPMFDRLSSGNHDVTWSGAYDIDFVLYAERSEPPWI